MSLETYTSIALIVGKEVQAINLDEAFNSIPKNSTGPKNAMTLGLRATIITTNNLKFEFLKVSQWGGKGYPGGSSGLSKALIGNTNEGKYRAINQIAGIGLSYSAPNIHFPLRIYGQLVGEDEAGNLPSCLIYLSGLEWKGLIFKKNTTFDFEIVDTRTKTSSHKNCGPNTAYNNNGYNF